MHIHTLYLRYFAAWATRQGITKPEDVTRADVERYQRWLDHCRKRAGGRSASVPWPLICSAACTRTSRICPTRPSMQWTWCELLSGNRDRAQLTELVSVSRSIELKDDRMPPPET